MVLVDTSVWVAHLKWANRNLAKLLYSTQVMTHDFVIGELACGNLKNRKEVLALLERLPRAPLVSQEEILYFIEQQSLMGKGIGFVDVHLLASAKLRSLYLWTLDASLNRIANRFELDYQS
ncbi:MAG: type II toxin-antitoxin system VapC family toxin [Candidatus Omnitrophica bacterium]|nr:type II toxin-antitoxin system VapC family toxin [Candidatus Omnitrophota bacterium]